MTTIYTDTAGLVTVDVRRDDRNGDLTVVSYGNGRTPSVRAHFLPGREAAAISEARDIVSGIRADAKWFSDREIGR